MQENYVDPENPEAVANENFTENSCSWTDQNTNILFYERPISHFISNNLTNREMGTMSYHRSHRYFFGGYWRFSLSGKKSLRLKCNA